MATSTDLKTWDVQVQDPLPELPAWATNGHTWAPDVTAGPDGYLMYLTARSVVPALQCIGVARSTSPTGPFRPVGDEPLICPEDEGGAIDAASYVEPDGKRYLLWKNDGNCCGKDTWLNLQPLSADGLKLTGPPVRLVMQDQPWEGNLVEAPTLVRHGSSYVLFYSANDYGGDKLRHRLCHREQARGPVHEGSRTAADECSDRRHRSRRPGRRHRHGRQDAHRVPRLGPGSRSIGRCTSPTSPGTATPPCLTWVRGRRRRRGRRPPAG